MRTQGFLYALLPLLGLFAPQAQAATSCPQNFAGSAWIQWEPETITPLSGGAATGITLGEGRWNTTGNNTNDNNSVPACGVPAGCLSLTFTVTAADVGYYKVEAYVLAPDTGSDSFFVGMVGLPDTCRGGAGGSSGNPAIRRWDINDNNNWRWRYVTDWDDNNNAARARVWYLTAGNYTLRFIGRENGTRLGKVRLLRLLDVLPTPTPTRTPTPIPTAVCSGTTTVMGNNVITGNVEQNGFGQANFYRWAAPSAGSAPGLWVYTTAPNGGEIRAALYSTNAGTPGTPNARLVESLPTYAPIGSNWVYIAFTAPVTLVSGTVYWMAFQVSDATVTVRYQATGTFYHFVRAQAYGGFVATASGPAATSSATNRRLAVYIPLCSVPPTNTPTPTPKPTKISGLPQYKRLYGLEYVPFPEIISGSFRFRGLDLTNTATEAVSKTARNTARFRIVFQNLSGTGLSQVQVETRLGPDGQECLTGYQDPDAYLRAGTMPTTLQLPDKPQNNSTSYFWVNGQVPITEQFDAMGDPRWVPYKDMMGRPSTETFANNYNWHFCNLATDAMGADYKDFVPRAVSPTTKPDVPNRGTAAGDALFGVNKDLPKLFMLWREALLNSSSVYNNIAGVTAFYTGFGGEIGGEGFNDLQTGLRLHGGPWGGAGTLQIDEIIGNAWKTGTRNQQVSVARSSVDTWQALPWIGELWPDSVYYSNWSASGSSSSWGNLVNSRNSGTFFRESLSVTASSTGAGTSFALENARHSPGDYGARMFMNQDLSPSFNHIDASTSVGLMGDGQIMGQDFNLAVPLNTTSGSIRPFSLSYNGTGGAPRGESYEWDMAPYNTRRMHLEYYSGNASLPDADRGFYDYTPGTNARSSAAIRGTLVDPSSSTKFAFFVISGLGAGTASGYDFLARFNLLATLRTFLEAGVPTRTAAGVFSTANLGSDGLLPLRIPPPPRIEITSPRLGEDLAGRSNIAVEWKERYARWDGARYTENYPCVDDTAGSMLRPWTTGDCPGAADIRQPGDPALEWHDAEPLLINLKYSADAGYSWTSALTSEAAEPGERMEGANAFPMSATSLYAYSWDVSGFTAGRYIFRVECYRSNIGSHFSYHEITMDLKP